METTPQPQKTAPEQDATANMVELAAYPVAAVAGAYAFNTTVGNKLYDDLHGLGKLGDELANHKKFFRNEGNVPLGKVAESLPEYHKKFSNILSRQLKAEGFHTIIDRFKGLHTAQKIDSIVAGATALGVTLGVLLTVANNQVLFRKLRDKDLKEAENNETSR